MEETGRTTAIEHVDLGPLVTGHEYADWLLTVVAPLEQDPTFHVTAFHVDITVSFTSALQRVDRTLLAKGLRGWCARQLAAAPEGASRHVMTVADTSLQLQVEKSPCPGERGRVSMFHAHPPVDFEGAVSRQLQTCLGTLLAAPADRCVLLFEKRDHLWSAGQLRIELEAALTFPSLGRVYEIWMVDTRAAAATFRCVIPAGHWADRHHDTAS